MADIVVDDGDVRITEKELAYILSRAPREIRDSVKADDSARYDYIAQVLQSKRIAEAALSSPPGSDDYFQAYYAYVGALKELLQKRFVSNLDIPDLTDLAKERYEATKDEIAQVPERRRASHILLFCNEGCAPEERRKDMEAILSRLEAGESFEELARLESDDLASARNDGLLNTLVWKDSKKVDADFHDALYRLEEVGELSPVVQSRYGFHVIRLEEVLPPFTRSFEELQPMLEEELRKEYVTESLKGAFDQYLPTEDLKIDGPLMDEVLKAIP